MTERDWLSATDPTPMLEFLGSKASDRKLKLFAVACCRPHVPLVDHPQAMTAISLAELAADGREVSEELSLALAALHCYPSEHLRGGSYQRFSGFTLALNPEPHALPHLPFSCLAGAAGWDAEPDAVVHDGEEMPRESRWREAVAEERRVQVTRVVVQ